MAIVYASISTGPFVADRIIDDSGRRFTLLKNSSGEAIGSITGRVHDSHGADPIGRRAGPTASNPAPIGPNSVPAAPNSARGGPRSVPGGKPRLDGIDFAARDGTWFLPSLYVMPTRTGDGTGPGRPILDQAGRDFARFERPSPSIRLIHLPTGVLTWEHHPNRPTYRIDNGYTASRAVLHQWFRSLTNRPFMGEIGPRLAGGPAGALALLLAAFFTYNAIREQDRQQQVTWANRRAEEL